MFTTGLVSFLYFLFPANFEKLSPKEKDVLGIANINATVNKPTVDTALLAYCINERVLPNTLNELYGGYLREERKLNLDELFSYEIINHGDCDYALNP